MLIFKHSRQSKFSQQPSPLWKSPPAIDRFTGKPNGEDERPLSDTLKSLLAPPYSAECELIDRLQVLSVYVAESGQVLCRIDLSVREGLDYRVVFSSVEKAIKGELSPAENEDAPYPVYKICGKTGQNITDGQSLEINGITEEEKLSVLREEFKRLKRLYFADHMTCYYNPHSKELEILKGNTTILRIPLANGLSLEECIRLLRRRFEDAMSPFDEDFDF